MVNALVTRGLKPAASFGLIAQARQASGQVLTHEQLCARMTAFCCLPKTLLSEPGIGRDVMAPIIQSSERKHRAHMLLLCRFPEQVECALMVLFTAASIHEHLRQHNLCVDQSALSRSAKPDTTFGFVAWHAASFD
ncbi:hypothetical protein AEGHOMDF_0286 [Methylobacterium soli]|nr:hypothetical protein AEGHOMDF_0286 [Methylobacterium soli]